nr:nucleoside 2-deoxyribosyltransferase [Methanomicrobium sp. W14]
MFILMCPCIKDPGLRAKGITKPSDINMFVRCVERCGTFGVEIVYLPCPETIYLGKEREPGSYLDNLNTPEFERLIKDLSGDVHAKIRDMGAPLCIVGVDSSPSCGVTATYYSDEKKPGRGAFLNLFSGIPAYDVSVFSKYRVYLAAPLFTAAERSFNRRLSEILGKNLFDVYLPQETGDCIGSREAYLNKSIFEKNLSELKKADIVVSVTDGADADSGTSWEMGFAYAMNKKVVSLRTDFRMAGPNERVNLMLDESSVVVTTVKDLIEALNSPVKDIFPYEQNDFL